MMLVCVMYADVWLYCRRLTTVCMPLVCVEGSQDIFRRLTTVCTGVCNADLPPNQRLLYDVTLYNSFTPPQNSTVQPPQAVYCVQRSEVWAGIVGDIEVVGGDVGRDVGGDPYQLDGGTSLGDRDVEGHHGGAVVPDGLDYPPVDDGVQVDGLGLERE